MSSSRRFFPEELKNLEAVMPVAAKDMNKVPYATRLLLRNTPVTKVHVITDSPIVEDDTEQVVWHDELAVLPYGSDFFDFRPKWMFQQMLKLMQNVTEGEWYVSVDADTFVVRPMELWSNNGPYLFKEVDSRRIVVPYDTFNQRVFGHSYYPFSVLNNIVLFNKSIIRDIMEYLGVVDSVQFAEEVCDIIGPKCYPAEAQFYLSWLLDRVPGFYGFPTIHVGWRGMYGGYEFSKEQIEETISHHGAELDILLLHSWETRPAGWSGGTYTAF